MKNVSESGKDKPLGWLKNSANSPAVIRLLILILGCGLLLVMFEVAIVPVRYHLEVGMVPTSTIAATKDVVDEIGTEERREEAASHVSSSYSYDRTVSEAVLQDFDQIFAQLRAVRQYGSMLPDASPNRVYTSDELQYARDMLTLVSLQNHQLTSLLHATQEELEDAYSILYSSIQSVMDSYVLEGQEDTAINTIRQISNYRISIPLGQYVVPPVLSACIRPNILIDHEATDAAREAAREAVEPIVYKQGQNIVVRGEGRITANQLAMLSTLGLLSDSGVDISIYLGAAILVVLVLTGMLLLLRDQESHIFDNTARLLLLFVILILSLGVCMLGRLINAYVAPTLLCALLMTALLGLKAGVVCNAAITVLVAALAAGGNEEYTEKMVMLIVSGLLSGTGVALLMHRRVNRLRTLLSGVMGCCVDFVAIMALGLMTSSALSGALSSAAWRALGSFLATLLCIGLQPLLEAIFNLPTPMKLLELSNPNQPLLRRLLLEAPGTYHHSTIVANLAEAAAEAIGANPLLARVGGYYHDIGKLKRPLYFAENQMGGVNAHDHTDPQVSAAIVTAHTRDGATMARAARLPEEIIDIIGNHHGSTPVMYFYHKALQQADGKPVDESVFRYDGHPPTTKEGAIVMLCDTIEAAVRTMKNPTAEGIEDFIVKLVRGKLEDGQLSDSPLTLRDIDKLCAAATTVLLGVFHERIEYPDMEETGKLRILHKEDIEAALEEEKAKESKEAKEAEKEQEHEGEPEDLHVEPAPVPDSLMMPDLQPQPPIPVVTPEAPPEFAAVTPPPAIKPVAIDDLVILEPLPTKAEEAANEEKPEEGPEENS